MIEYPIIPETIVVHLGAPGDNGQNVTVNFADYIKNVASSEIYPTWPEEAIKANIYAQISVAMNRVYTEFYRSNGRNFDITNSPAYDQTFIYQRNIYDNISAIVDEIFNSYIRRVGNIEPLFATFCDGVEVNCDGLTQWGSVTLANQGLDAFSILQNFYGNDIELVTDVPVDSIPQSAPRIPLKEGDTGRSVELIQRKLNRISKNFPGIPKIYPADGFFDKSTTDAVIKFQEVFDLTPDGIVGSGTWNRIQFIYNSVKELSSINSEGLRIEDLSTQYGSELSVGDSSPGVLTLQYYLGYISLFVPTVTATAIDGDFGEGTRNSVISYQKTYGLSETGVVDEVVWNSIQNTYYSFLQSIDYEFTEGTTLPFPGRVLRVGIEGEDVRALQQYLNYISDYYQGIPKLNADGVYGALTAEAVNAFNTVFGLPGSNGRVSAQVWYAITSIYEDLFNGRTVNSGQYPGYELT